MASVLITGADGLLGKVYVKAFAEAGYDVRGTDLPEHDVTDAQSWIRLRWTPDILINNAGLTNNTGMPPDPFGSWDRILDVNLTGTMLGCKLVGEAMVRRGRGCIINVASQYGLVSPHHDIYEGMDIKQPLAYSVSKAGVLQMTRYLACLWGPHGVRVNCLVPGGVYNKQHPLFVEQFSKLNPMGRMAEPKEMASAMLYIAESTYMNGAALVVDGGWTAW